LYAKSSGGATEREKKTSRSTTFRRADVHRRQRADNPRSPVKANPIDRSPLERMRRAGAKEIGRADATRAN